MGQPGHQGIEHFAIPGKNGTGQGIWACVVQDVQGGIKIFIFIYINSEHRSEDLFGHGFIIRCFGLDHGGVNKITLGFIPLTADDDFSIGRFLCP